MVKRLPDSEFEVMKAVWDTTPPVTTLQVMEKLASSKEWKPQTVLTMLVRLIDKGFLKSGRVGRERVYIPAIQKLDYMKIETSEFLNRYRGNSLGSLVKTLYDGQTLSKEELLELKEWLKERT